MHWEARYSSCEMMYLDVVGDQVRCYLDTPDNADCYTFQQVLNGALDNEVRAVFGESVLDEIKAIAGRKTKRKQLSSKTTRRNAQKAKSAATRPNPSPAPAPGKRDVSWGTDSWAPAKTETGADNRPPNTPPESTTGHDA